MADLANRAIRVRGTNEGLLRIIGARLSSVQFVLNHLILGFDEKGALTSLVWPQAMRSDHILKFGDPGYRDRLCELIEKVVTGAAVDYADTITIRAHRFAPGS